MFNDAQAWLDSGQALLHGQYASLYPLPLVGLFALFANLPLWVVGAIISGLSLLILVALFRRRAVWWILYVPILQTLFLGNLDVLGLWLLQHESAVSLALLTLKPQIAVFALPALIRRRDLWRPFAFWCAILYGPVTIAYPRWVGEWLGRLDDGRLGAGTGASLWVVPALAVAFGLAMWVTRSWNWRAAFSALNPTMRSYDYTMLAGAHWALVPLSWITNLLANVLQSAAPTALIGVGAWGLAAMERSQAAERDMLSAGKQVVNKTDVVFKK